MVRPLLVCGLLMTLSRVSYGGDQPSAKLPPASNPMRAWRR